MNENRENFNKFEISSGRREANAKERIRTYSVNAAFAVLRNLIPTEPPDRRLSKIETLRLASSYISHLTSILVTGTCEKSSVGTFSTDFTFGQRPQICTFCMSSGRLKSNWANLTAEHLKY